ALMAQFANNLGRMERAEALRQAQLAVMQRAPHPYYWAAPVLLGRTDALGPITPAPARPPAPTPARNRLAASGVALLAAGALAVLWAWARRRARRGAATRP